MNTINQEKFGNFLFEARKAKQLTQKELGDQLYVSDKTISKWERGCGMPNVALLLPIAEVLDVSLSQLLQGESTTPQHTSTDKEMMQQLLNKRKHKWYIFCIVSIIITISELLYLSNNDQNFHTIKENIYLVCALMLTFGTWFTIFAKPLLPYYYDRNKVNFYAQGIFKIHMPGISFTNSNWYYICTTCKLFTLLIAPLYPCIYLILSTTLGFSTYVAIADFLLFGSLLCFFLSFYFCAIKYK